MDALHFLRSLFEHQSYEVMKGFVIELLADLTSAISAEWYKIISEGLRVVDSLLILLPPIPNTGDDIALYASMAKSICASVVPRLEASDMDVEIKVRLKYPINMDLCFSYVYYVPYR